MNSYTDDGSKVDFDMGFESEGSLSLQFPTLTTQELYERIGKHQLKIHVPGFEILQANCPNKKWDKLMRLNSTSNKLFYHLIARHSIGKQGRILSVSSPLQVSNIPKNQAI